MPHMKTRNSHSKDWLRTSALFAIAAGILISNSGCKTTHHDEGGFVSLFDGKSLDGWKLVGKKGEGYGVTNGVLYCARGGGGNLLTEKEFCDFVLRLDFKIEEGGNNGVGIRAPMSGGDVAYVGMEIQVLDDKAPKHAKILPG